MKVIDVSKHQGTFDPAVAKAAGIDAVITRLAYAASPDRLALSWCPGIKAAGLRLGAYGFGTWHYQSQCGGDAARARQLMIRQVDAWIKLAKQHGVGWWLGVDQECELGQQMALDKAVNTQLLNDACTRLAAAGLHPCVYCSTSWDKQHISTADLRWPYWFARYVDGDADFGDPGADLDRLSDSKTTAFMRRMRDEGRLVGWQYGSTGHGHKYGAGSDNIDRNVFYLDVPRDGAGKETTMEFKPIKDKLLDVTSTKPACQSFAAPTVEADSWYNLPIGKYPITAQGDTTQLAGMTGTWYKIDCPAAKDCIHVLALPDRCQVIDAPVEPQQPAVPDTPTEPVKPTPVPVILQPRLDLSGLAADLRRLADAIDDAGKAGV